MTPCSLVDRYRRLGGIRRLDPQGPILNFGVSLYSEASVTFYRLHAVTMKSTVFRNMTPCCLVYRYR
jgi:hypothetical protein